ncbi:MAG: zinc-dependent metalloprotease [Myxococcota bacterium]|nr:zinc-dependent metalloprotease [Myxococcota bacterium]
MKNMKSIAALLFLSACAGGIEDIDRTQPNILDKDFFVGEWYASWTVVDAPFTTGFAFVGAGEGIERIKWDITERGLVGYRSYDLVANTDKTNEREGAAWRGPMIYHFPVKRHFDVKRGYNAATGEQNNVLSENGSDCRWYNCKKFRVDWNSNIRFRGENGSYYIQESDDDDAADAIRFDKESGHFEVTLKAFFKPELDQELTRSYGFPIPKCWLYANPYWDCRGQTLRVRMNFSRMPHSGDVRDENNVVTKVGEPIADDYDAVPYNDHRLERFGFFRTTRFHHDQYYGTREGNRDHFANLHPIWKKVRENGQSIPIAEREPKPIVYYLNKRFPGANAPVNLIPEAQVVAGEWNEVLKEAVAAAQGKDLSDVPDMFVLCANNPVKAGDDPLCGAEGLEVRIGDHRYNKLVWVPNPAMSAPGGYGPSNSDPLTGKVVSADSYIYGAGYERAAASIVDLVRLLSGDLEQGAYIDGSDLRAQIEAARARYTEQRSSLTLEEISRSARALERSGLPERIAEQVDTGELETGRFHDMIGPLVANGLHKKLSNAELVTMASGGLHEGDEEPEVFEQHNALTLARQLVERDELRLKKAGEQSIDLALFSDASMLQLARRLRSKPELQNDGAPDYDKIRSYIMRLMFRATALHEIGHNLGLRHNFAGSSDALNYHDSYWALKAELGVLDPEFLLGEEGLTALAQNTDEDGVSLREYQYSSIMDYSGRWYTDLQGLGKYDRAAILYGYANKVEVWNFEGRERLADVNTRALWSPNNYHYTAYPRILAGLPLDAPTGRGTVGGRPVGEVIGLLKERTLTDVGSDGEMADSTLTNLRVPYRFCSDEYAGGASYCHRFDEGADVFETVRNRIEKADGYRPLAATRRDRLGWHTGWSYMPWTIRNFEFLSAQYKHFVNEEFIIRRGWDCVDPSNGQPLMRKDDDGNPIEDGEIAHYIAEQCGLEQFFAGAAAAQFFVKVLQQPDEGTYCFNDTRQVYEKIEASQIDGNAACAADSIELDGIGDDAVGHLSKWDPEKDGYYAFIRPNYAGHWMDKWGALSYLTETTTNFVGVDSSSDTRSFQINFLNIFGTQLHSIIAGLVMGDATLYGPAWRMPDPDDAEDLGEYERRTSAFLLRGSDFDPAEYKAIDPGDRFFTRYVSLIMAAAWSVQATNERDLNNNFKIGITGSIDSQLVPDAVRTDPEKYIELMNPVNMRTYFAVRTENYSWRMADPDERFVALGYDMLKTISDRFYENGVLKSAVLDSARADALQRDASLAGADLDAAALAIANSDVHKEFFWVDMIRSIVDAYEFD